MYNILKEKLAAWKLVIHRILERQICVKMPIKVENYNFWSAHTKGMSTRHLETNFFWEVKETGAFKMFLFFIGFSLLHQNLTFVVGECEITCVRECVLY